MYTATDEHIHTRIQHFHTDFSSVDVNKAAIAITVRQQNLFLSLLYRSSWLLLRRVPRGGTFKNYKISDLSVYNAWTLGNSLYVCVTNRTPETVCNRSFLSLFLSHCLFLFFFNYARYKWCIKYDSSDLCDRIVNIYISIHSEITIVEMRRLVYKRRNVTASFFCFFFLSFSFNIGNV